MRKRLLYKNEQLKQMYSLKVNLCENSVCVYVCVCVCVRERESEREGESINLPFKSGG